MRNTLPGSCAVLIRQLAVWALDAVAARTAGMALLLAMLVLGSPAQAMFCLSLGSSGLAIGEYEPLSPHALDAQASMAIECFPAAPGEQLNMSVRLLNVADGRLMLINTNADHSSTLTVRLYRDAARTIPLDEQAVISFTDRPIMPTRYWITLYARVPARQDAAAGRYQLPLTLSIQY